MRAITTFVATVTLALMVPLAGAAGASASTEGEFVVKMNEERTSRGLVKLTVVSDLVSYARAHSEEMASQNDLHHSDSLRTLDNWKMLGENVGRGGSVQSLHDAFMASTGHRENILRSNFSEVGVGVVMSGDTIWVTVVFREPVTPTSSSTSSSDATTSLDAPDAVVSAFAYPGGAGYWIVRRNGEVVAKGDAPWYGDASGVSHTGMVDAIAHPSGKGYWLISDRGGVYTYGNTKFHGSAASLPIVGKVITGMAHPSGKGYYLVTDQGAVYTFGDAPFYGAATDIPKTSIVDAIMHPSGKGYWLISDRGGVYTFGDVPFFGSAASIAIVGAIRNGVTHPSGDGYWLITDRGGVYTFGDVPFFGAATDVSPEPFVDAAADPNGAGNWLVTASGTVYEFGDVPNYGSA